MNELRLDPWEVGSTFEVWVNQGNRDATVLAAIGYERLIEYTMPKGTTAMHIITIDEAGHIVKTRRITYKKFPRKWAEAMKEAGTEWIGVKQGRRSLPPYPQPYEEEGIAVGS